MFASFLWMDSEAEQAIIILAVALTVIVGCIVLRAVGHSLKQWWKE